MAVAWDFQILAYLYQILFPFTFLVIPKGEIQIQFNEFPTSLAFAGAVICPNYARFPREKYIALIRCHLWLACCKDSFPHF